LLVVPAVALALGMGQLAVLSAVAQQTEETPVFRGAARLLEVEVKVAGREGRPVEDLTQEEFSLQENGEPRTIATFEFVEGPKETTSQDDQTDPVLGRPRTREAIESLLRQTTWIYIARQGNMLARSRAYGAIRNFIEKDLRRGVAVSLAGAPFTSNKRQLLSTLDQMAGETPGDYSHLSQQADREFLGQIEKFAQEQLEEGPQGSAALRRLSEIQAAQGDRSNIETYIDLARGLGALPGKKIVVLFSPAFAITPETMDLVRRLEAEALQSRVSFYPVDARGLTALGNSSTKNIGAAEGSNFEALISSKLTAESYQDLKVMADVTGGQAVIDNTNLGEVFERVYEDRSRYYVLGYYPPPSDKDKERRISIKVSRPGVQLTYRRGYTDESELAKAARQERERITDKLVGLNRLQSALQRRRWQEAEDLASSLNERYPGMGRVQFSLALARFHLSDLESAERLAIALQSSVLGIDFPETHQLLGLIRKAEGKYGPAAKEFRRYLALAPEASNRDEIERQVAEWERRVEAPTVATAGVRVKNRSGNVKLRVGRKPTIQLRRSSPDRELRRSDVVMTEQAGLIEVEARPDDGVRVDLEIDVPYGTAVGIETESGSISLTGLIFRADLATDSGDVNIAVPWDTTRFVFTAVRKPNEFTRPKGLKVEEKTRSSRSGKVPAWEVRDRHKATKVTYGGIQLDAGTPGKMVLENIPVPANSPIKMPWHAPGLLRRIQAGLARSGEALGTPLEDDSSPSGEPWEAVFTSDVRMVNLTVSVTGEDGKPVEDLDVGDFEVKENAARQQIAAVHPSEGSFNLAILLDLSASTFNGRETMMEAARRFVGIARAQDRVALYALVNSFFWELSPLTANHEVLKNRIDALPELSGASPLYDTLITAYSHELWHHPGERNALIVLTDGLDNSRSASGSRLEPGLAFRYGVPSQITKRQLLAAAKDIDALLYPVLLPLVLRETSFVTSQSDLLFDIRGLFRQLAETTGGQVFSTSSLKELEPVYSRVAKELRSVYGVSYYPTDQEFDSSWRELDVRVEKPGVSVRTRRGYWAK
jgi:VWFA-related protein